MLLQQNASCCWKCWCAAAAVNTVAATADHGAAASDRANSVISCNLVLVVLLGTQTAAAHRTAATHHTAAAAVGHNAAPLSAC